MIERARTLPLLVVIAIAACAEPPEPEPRTRAARSATSTVRTPPMRPPGPAIKPRPVRAPPRLGNPTAYIPPQCYVRTVDDRGGMHNACFTCHVEPVAPNFVDDHELQYSYAFPPPARINPWTNLFVDRRAAVAAISDQAILAYVRRDNYRLPGRAPTGNQLAARLASPPPAWDADGDGRWGGWVPDLALRIDERGFDRTADGGYTGWRAYASYPVPGAFWPTNGSFGDTLIRLPARFREDRPGHFDRAVYELNLAILESLIARRDVAIEPSDERVHGVDLDGDGGLGIATVIRHRDTLDGELAWVGAVPAREGTAVGLFPEGTELAHSLRYLDVVGGQVRMAARMKELRYMVKTTWLSPAALRLQTALEINESYATVNGARPVEGDAERGVVNGAGWRIQGFIEDEDGDLRPQTFEEQVFCTGCHAGVGATDDSVFSFARKLPPENAQRGWSHGSQHGLSGLAEPLRADGRGEYAHFLDLNGAGDELRANDEVLARFFDRAGRLRPAMLARLRRDVSVLLVPGPRRALTLDKAYRVIVGEQSFARGRDATVTPVDGAHRALLDGDRSTLISIGTDRRDGAAFVYPGIPVPAAKH